MGDHVVLQGIPEAAIRNAEVTGLCPGKLAINLLVALFSYEELSTGNCTKPSREDICLLDQVKIQAIRGMQVQVSIY